MSILDRMDKQIEEVVSYPVSLVVVSLQGEVTGEVVLGIFNLYFYVLK